MITMDTNAISKTILSKLKQKILGKSPYGNRDWKRADNEWYTKIHDSNYLLHDDFKRYFAEKNDIKTVLEVGCGTGIYPIREKNLFENKSYTGIDFSDANVEYCKKNSDFEFLQGDFIKMDIQKKYDLVFSHAVIDHVYDIDKFLANIVKACKKYAYINAYRGFFPDLKKHKMTWKDSDNCYYNDLSIIQAKQVLLQNGLSESEFVIRAQESGQKEKNLNLQTVIEITKSQV